MILLEETKMLMSMASTVQKEEKNGKAEKQKLPTISCELVKDFQWDKFIENTTFFLWEIETKSIMSV